jgi:hypothetical protein
MNNTHNHGPVVQHRFAGLTLLVSFLLFWGGTGLSIPLVDSKGTSIYFLSPQQELPVIAAHAAIWLWQSLLQLGGSLVATVGLALLALVLWTAGSQVWSLLGIIAFLLSEVLWLVIESFRLGTGIWVTHETTSTTAPGFYDLLFRWLEGSLFAIAISLALGALAAYACAVLTTRGLPRWAGWVILVYAFLGLGVVVVAGAALLPPEFVYLALLFLGVVFWFRRVPVDPKESGVSQKRSGGDHPRSLERGPGSLPVAES